MQRVSNLFGRTLTFSNGDVDFTPFVFRLPSVEPPPPKCCICQENEIEVFSDWPVCFAYDCKEQYYNQVLRLWSTLLPTHVAKQIISRHDPRAFASKVNTAWRAGLISAAACGAA